MAATSTQAGIKNRFFILRASSLFRSYDSVFIGGGDSVLVCIIHFPIEMDCTQGGADLGAPCQMEVFICFHGFDHHPVDAPALIGGQDEDCDKVAFRFAAPIAGDASAADHSVTSTGHIKMRRFSTCSDGFGRMTLYAFFDIFLRIIPGVADPERFLHDRPCRAFRLIRYAA